MSDTVTLDISTYNNLKSDALRANLVVDHLFRTATSGGKGTSYAFEWDISKLNDILEITYPKRFTNKIAELEEVEATQ